MYNIRHAKKTDLNEIQKFLHENWKKNHILSRDKKLLLWQHQNVDKKLLCFVILENKLKKIKGLIGYISINSFSNYNKKKDEIWLCIWSINKKVNGVYGLSLINYFIKNDKYESIGAIGLTENICKLYKKLNFQVGAMQHFYIKNNQIKETYISKNLKKIKFKKIDKTNLIEIKKVTKSLFNFDVKIKPKKNENYYFNRYVKHPKYKYRFFSFVNKFGRFIVLITRDSHYKNNSVLRIIDIAGNWNKKNTEGLGWHLNNLLVLEKKEYIDMYYFGKEIKDIKLTGFKLKTTEIIPNHFEPYILKSKLLIYAYFSKNSYRLFKGDADSDRPNIYD